MPTLSVEVPTPSFNHQTRSDQFTPSSHTPYSPTPSFDQQTQSDPPTLVIPACDQVLKLDSMNGGGVASCPEDVPDAYSPNEHTEIPLNAQACVNTPDDIAQEHIGLKTRSDPSGPSVEIDSHDTPTLLTIADAHADHKPLKDYIDDVLVLSDDFYPPDSEDETPEKK